MRGPEWSDCLGVAYLQFYLESQFVAWTKNGAVWVRVVFSHFWVLRRGWGAQFDVHRSTPKYMTVLGGWWSNRSLSFKAGHSVRHQNPHKKGWTWRHLPPATLSWGFPWRGIALHGTAIDAIDPWSTRSAYAIDAMDAGMGSKRCSKSIQIP